MPEVMEREIQRLMSLRWSQAIPYEIYMTNPEFKFVEAHCNNSHNLDWLKNTYKTVCDEYGYMPIEIAYDKDCSPQINVFYTLKRTILDKIKKQYFAVFVDKGGLR